MAEHAYAPVRHDHNAFLERAAKKPGFQAAYDGLAEEAALAHQLLKARARAGLTQAHVAEKMGTTTSAVSRLESAGKHSPSLTTLRRYAEAVGCQLQVKLVPRQ